MGGLFLPRDFQAPPTGARVNWDAPQAAGLRCLVPPAPGSVWADNVVGAPSTTRAATASADGGWTFDSTNPALTFTTGVTGWTGHTVAVEVLTPPRFDDGRILWTLTSDGASNDGLRAAIGTPFAGLDLTLGAVEGLSSTLADAFTGNARLRLVIAFTLGTGFTVWGQSEGGEVKTSAVATANTPVGTPGVLTLSASLFGAYYYKTIYHGGYAARAWSDAEARAWLAEPFALLTR